tara:strand:+ start:830 stop:1099 length:270 start_codon:yes stop_codon:yes gene_type:complete
MNKILEQILSMDNNQLDDVICYVNERRSQISAAKRLEFSINDEVWIDHKNHGKTKVYIVDSINQKTISIKSKDGFKGYRVSPSMLNKIS